MESGEDLAVHCWGCSKIILVPYASDGKPAEMFKCGWCEAINDLKQQRLLLPPQFEPLGPPWQAQHPQHHQQDPQQMHAADYYTQQQLQWQQQQQLQPPIWQPRQELPSTGGTSSYSTNQRSSSRHSLWSRCWPFLLAAWRWVVVALVLTLVFSIAGFGIGTLLPLVCSTWLTYLPNVSLALLLLFQILFNYAAAVLRPAGKVSDYFSPPPRTSDGDVPQGGLQYWNWCQHCQAAKPPRVHHCKACGTCVVQMDHHCPFLANCVGQGNLRAFLLVLLWVLLAAAYILCMCGLLVWQHWDKVRASVGAGANTTTSSSSTSSISSTSMQPPQVWDVNPAGRVASAGDAVPVSSVGSTNSSIPPGVTRVTAVEEAGSALWLYATTGILILVLQGSPGWLLIAYYLMAISLGLLIGVGMLFGSQLHYLGLGVSYIDHLKAAHGGQNLFPSRQHGLEQQQQQQQSGCWHRMQLTWVQWWAVMGCASPGTAWSMLQAIMTPMWKAPATATKKWS